MEKYLIVVDFQNDFVTGALGTKEARAIEPYVREKIEQRRKEGYDVIFTRDTHFNDYLETQEGKKLPVPHCIYRTEGWKIVKETDRKFESMKRKTNAAAIRLQEEANEKIAAMVREKTDELLDKVLRERSNEMKIAYARADA